MRKRAEVFRVRSFPVWVLLMVLTGCGPAKVSSSSSLAPPSSKPSRFIGVETDPSSSNFGSLKLVGFDPPEVKSLAVFTNAGASLKGGPSVLGKKEVVEGAVFFRPRYPFVPGLAYEARVTWLSGDLFIGPFSMAPKEEEPSTSIVQVYPSGDVLPENLLKFYVHFSSSMSVGDVFDSIHLFGPSGQELPDVFLGQELWDTERKRLTVLFEPGRIKRDLVPHQEQGAPLAEGGRFRLVIDRGLEDGRGLPLREGFEKIFEVGPADREMPIPSTFQVLVPSAGSPEPVQLQFSESLDAALLLSCLRVVTAAGNQVVGSIHLLSGETGWSFCPEKPWSRGSYCIQMRRELEDLAGNNLRSVFDAEVGDSPSEAEGQMAEITFDVGANNAER